jgi:hypothetical protein
VTVFLAHGKQTPNDEIDAWVTELGALLSATVVAGRDDYLSRSRAMGGWNTWVKDVPVAEDWSGDALFHGIAVPVLDFDQPSVGRATYALVEGFLSRGKPVYAWNYITNQIGHVIGLAEKQSDAWTDVGVLLIQETP